MIWDRFSGLDPLTRLRLPDRIEPRNCYRGAFFLSAAPSGSNVTAVPSPQYCVDCHPKEVAQNSRSKHTWTAFMGPLKPYYLEAKADGLDPLSQETAKILDPEHMAKTALTPLFPDSGILAKIGLLDDPTYHHNNVNLRGIECHGSFVIPQDDGTLVGWPNADVDKADAGPLLSIARHLRPFPRSLAAGLENFQKILAHCNRRAVSYWALTSRESVDSWGVGYLHLTKTWLR